MNIIYFNETANFITAADADAFTKDDAMSKHSKTNFSEYLVKMFFIYGI